MPGRGIIGRMALIEHYLALKATHVALVVTSGSLFAVRGMAVLAGQRWAMQQPWRTLSYTIDTLLLAAGVTLWVALGLGPVRSPWLGTKLALLVVYVILGSLALKRGRTPAVQRASYAAALATYLFMASVAVHHRPSGMFGHWMETLGP